MRERLKIRRALVARQERLKEEFERHGSARFAEELFGLADGRREEILEASSGADEARLSQPFLSHGWTPKNAAALAILRGWMRRARPELLDELLPLPEDRTFEAWLAWRLDQQHQS